MKPTFRPKPLQILAGGYLLITIIGTILLSLPAATADGSRQPILDAWFLATSAVSTSGLTVVDISRYYSPFGQIIIMAIFQIGGLGYMSFFVFMLSLLKKNLTISRRVVAIESVSGAGELSLSRFFKAVILTTFSFESIGALIFYLSWHSELEPARAAYLSVFHSVSAFCTAGFSLFSDSLVSFQENLPINLTISLLSLFGGVGFIVLIDLQGFLSKAIAKKRPRRLSPHTRLVLAAMASIMAVSFVTIILVEPFRGLRVGDKILAALFQAISASTTDGFNTVDIGALAPSALLVLIFLMLIGAGPGSTAGGFKISTFGTLVLAVWSFLHGKKDVNFQGRRIPDETISKAFFILFIFLGVAAFDAVILANTEEASFLQLIFEISSALGNTGLSMGITSSLTPVGRILITLTMFLGRVGPLTLGLSLLGRKSDGDYHYAKAAIYVG
ncbi:MAG: Trk family potassium uptake protein [Candidatus Aminicenantes bacterium]|nr:Trk family potassium uptake protein [Candidatus Aminicenantes bacterium]